MMSEKSVKDWSKEFVQNYRNSIWRKINACASCRKKFKSDEEMYTIAGGGTRFSDENTISVFLYLPNSYVLYFCRDCFEEVAGEYWLLNSKEVF